MTAIYSINPIDHDANMPVDITEMIDCMAEVNLAYALSNVNLPTYVWSTKARGAIVILLKSNDMIFGAYLHDPPIP